MDVGYSQWGFPASTMVPQYHLVQSYYPIFPKNIPPPPAQVLQCKGAPIRPSTEPPYPTVTAPLPVCSARLSTAGSR